MQNLTPNDGQGKQFALWTPTVIDAATAPVGTFGATSGPDNMPGLTLSSTGTAGGVQAVATIGVEGEGMLFLAALLKGSSATPTLVPFAVSFTDAAGNAIVTATPIASAVAPTAFTAFTSAVAIPGMARTASVSFAALSWSATGGYSVVMASPQVMSA
jgi:hypothetical protein